MRIETGGLELGESVRVARPLAAVQDMSGMTGADGAWLLAWSEVAGAMAYEVHTSAVCGAASNWEWAARVDGNRWQSRAQALAWVRVRALGVSSVGPWSEPLLVRNRDGSARMAA
jgi:hypothetical protein